MKINIEEIINTKQFRNLFTKHISSALGVPEDAADIWFKHEINKEINMLGKALSEANITQNNTPRSRDLSSFDNQALNDKIIKEE